MTVTRIKFRHDGELVETMYLENRADVGPEIRQEHAPDCDAGTSAVFDLDVSEYGDIVIELLGLDDNEVDRIVAWRDAAKMTPDERVAEHMTPAELGKVLDKIAKCLKNPARRDIHRIVVEVEPTP
jgi:hypothetical protein